MPDTILDDVKELLDKEKGDKRILEQIQRAAENNEVISNYERNYVRKLAEKHLGRKSVEEIPSAPDVVIEPKQTVPKVEIIPRQEPVSYKTSKPKNTKLIMGIGGAILAVIIIAAVSLSGIPTSTTTELTPSETIPSETILSVQMDLSSYNKGDIISISGKTDPSLGPTVNLSIKNEQDQEVWLESVKIKPDGRYSTLTIAGGDGWQSGTFTITASHGSELVSHNFSFNG